MEATTLPTGAGTEAPRSSRPVRELLPSGAAGALVLVATLGLAFASLAEFGWTGRAVVGAIFCPALGVLAAIDLEHRLLPNAVVFPSTLLVALAVAAFDPHGFLSHLEAGVALFAFLFIFAAVFPAGLGMGDAKTGLLIGLALGYRTYPAMMIAFVAVFVAALWVLARHGLSARKTSLPFGPFLAAGGILAFFFT
jgi:leader peptidase (prepilin peptidase)/N-methyltransferase